MEVTLVVRRATIAGGTLVQVVSAVNFSLSGSESEGKIRLARIFQYGLNIGELPAPQHERLPSSCDPLLLSLQSLPL